MFVRLHHTQARKCFFEGKTVVICPSNLCPGSPWHPECYVSLDMVEDRCPPWEAWNRIRNHFRFYNCINSETGKYISYWTTA